VVTLKEARAARGLSQRALATRAAVGVSTVLRIEHGGSRPRPHIARRLSAALGLPPEQVEELRPAAAKLRLPAPAVRAAVAPPARGDHRPAGDHRAGGGRDEDELAPGPAGQDQLGDVGVEGVVGGEAQGGLV
jgi:transcriptional regulator with XRE-family HTH domain